MKSSTRLFLLILFCGTSFGAQADYLYETVEGSVFPHSFAPVRIEAHALNGVPGCDSRQVILSDENGDFEADVPVFPGQNQITVSCKDKITTRLVEKTFRFEPMRIALSWPVENELEFSYLSLYLSNFDTMLGWLDAEDVPSSGPVTRQRVSVQQLPNGGIFDISANLDSWGSDVPSVATMSIWWNGSSYQRFSHYRIAPWAPYNPWIGATTLSFVLPDEGAEFGGGTFMWRVGVVAVNAESEAAWYEVDEENRRVVSRSSTRFFQGALVGLGVGAAFGPYSDWMTSSLRYYVGEWYRFRNFRLTGPTGHDPEVVLLGQSIQLQLLSDHKRWGSSEIDYDRWDTDLETYGGLEVTENPDTGEPGAYIDTFGIFSAFEPGLHRVSGILGEVDPDTGEPIGIYPTLDILAVEPPLLIMDSDRDGVMSVEEQDWAEAISDDPEALITFLQMNRDDDDKNEISDYLDVDDPVTDEDDLIPFSIPIAGANSERPISVKLSATSSDGGAVRIWTNPEKGGDSSRINLPEYWDLRQKDPSGSLFYMEGIAPGTVTLKIEYSGEEFEKEYTVKIIDVDLDVDVDLNGDIDDDDDGIEVSSGGLLGVYEDDKNNNGIPDIDEPRAVADNDGLLEIHLALNDAGMNSGTLTLTAVSGGSKIKVWEDYFNKTECLGTWAIGTNTVPPILYVEGLEISAAARDIELLLRYTNGPVEFDDNITLTILKVELTAHRPTTPPFQNHEVPDDQEESPGAGIRINGDGNEGAGENDLIEVELEVGPFPIPDGIEYVLRRNNSSINVWDSSAMGSNVLSGTEEVIKFDTSGNRTVWVENPSGGDADLELVAKDSEGNDVCSDKIHFYPFTSVVVLFEGEGRNPHDPPTTGNWLQDLKGVGVSTMALDLYLGGYDVHSYADSPSSVGFDEIKSAVTERDVDNVALIGYSHGGGSVYETSLAMDLEATAFNLKYTAYIDAIKQPFTSTATEDRRPTNSVFHVNYFQNGEPLYLNLEGALCTPAGAGIELNIDTPSSPETHMSIDDNAAVQASIISNLKTKLPQP